MEGLVFRVVSRFCRASTAENRNCVGSNKQARTEREIESLFFTSLTSRDTIGSLFPGEILSAR